MYLELFNSCELILLSFVNVIRIFQFLFAFPETLRLFAFKITSLSSCNYINVIIIVIVLFFIENIRFFYKNYQLCTENTSFSDFSFFILFFLSLNIYIFLNHYFYTYIISHIFFLYM